MKQFFQILVCGGLLLTSLGTATAVTRNISAEFTPSLLDPHENKFKDTTPPSGVCSSTHLQSCRERNVFSIDTGIRPTKTVSSIGWGAEAFSRDSLYFRLPGPRKISVVSDKGEAAEVTVRITGVAFRVAAPYENESFSTEHPSGDPQGCTQVYGNNYFNTQKWGSLMRVLISNAGPDARAECVHEKLKAATWEYSLDIVYELETPNPLEMRSGTYRTPIAVSYTVGGAGSDIDLGNNVTVNDSMLNINFTLQVNHVFNVSFNEPSQRRVLNPVGGWLPWIEHGRAPSSLTTRVPFYLDGSSDFTLRLRCQHPQPDGRCALQKNGSTLLVPVDTKVTIPNYRFRTGGEFFWGEATDVVLNMVLAPLAKVFRPGNGAVFSHRSWIDFSISDKDDIKTLLDNPEEKFSGRVTLVFEANI